VTEAEWQNATDPQAMLKLVSAGASERKLRLFAVACCRRLDALMSDQCRCALDVAERHSDHGASDDELQDAYTAAYFTWRRTRDFAARPVASGVRAACMGSADPARATERSRGVAVVAAASYAATNAAQAVAFARGPAHCDPATVTREYTLYQLQHLREYGTVGFERFEVEDPAWRATVAAEQAIQCQLLRDLFGNPFDSPLTIGPERLGWRDGVIVRLGASIYEGRTFCRLPLLADALEDAGSTDADLLGHLRGPSPHVRGCRALDRILAKE
jgi:hypothetical protein